MPDYTSLLIQVFHRNNVIIVMNRMSARSEKKQRQLYINKNIPFKYVSPLAFQKKTTSNPENLLRK